jgi:hypothetical protein
MTTLLLYPKVAEKSRVCTEKWLLLNGYGKSRLNCFRNGHLTVQSGGDIHENINAIIGEVRIGGM